jgi:hypothetical protein
MKKKFLLPSIMIVFILIQSCSKTETVKACYTFTSKMVTSVTPSTPGYPQTTTTTSEKCDLTSEEAKDYANSMKSTTNSTQQGISVTVTVTVTYKIKQ